MYYYYAWEMIVLVHYKLSFVERLSSSRRVLYWRFHCIRNRGVPIYITDEDRILGSSRIYVSIKREGVPKIKVAKRVDMQ